MLLEVVALLLMVRFGKSSYRASVAKSNAGFCFLIGIVPFLNIFAAGVILIKFVAVMIMSIGEFISGGSFKEKFLSKFEL